MSVSTTTTGAQVSNAAAPLPGDKSISHRLLMLALVADGPSRLARLNEGADVRHTREVVRALGARLDDDGTSTRVTPPARLLEPTSPLDCGNAGTLARLLAGLLVGARVRATLVGDDSLSRRPMTRVAEPLAQLFGMPVVELAPRGTLPLTTLGRDPKGAALERRVVLQTKSAQVKSALLLAGLGLESRVVIHEPVPTRAHTERLLAHLGVGVSLDDDGGIALAAGKKRVRGFALRAPGDPSAAAFRVVLALGRGGALSLDDVLVGARRTGFVDALARAGAGVRIEVTTPTKDQDGFEPFPDEVGRIVVDDRACVRVVSTTAAESADLIDEIPALAMLAAVRRGTHVFAGVDELRVKESDRLALLVRGLVALGVDAREHDNDLVIDGAPMGRDAPPVVVETGSDHRIAMAFLTLAALTGRAISVDDTACVDVSEPGFMNALRVLADALPPPP